MDAATKKFEQAIKLNPNLTPAWNGLGWSQFNSGQPDDAVNSFEKVIKLEPNHPAALNGLGQIYFSRHQFDKAEPILLKAAPSAPAAWWALTKMYLLQGKWDQAQKYAQKILDSNPLADPERADATGLLDAAKNKILPDDIRQKISPPTSMVSPSVQQGWLAMNHGNTVKARELFTQALNDNPTDPDALNGIGWLMLRTGDLPAPFSTPFENQQ